MMDGRILGSLGLCSKAGKLIFGVPMIIEAMQKGKNVLLVLEAGDTSDNTHKKISDNIAVNLKTYVMLSAAKHLCYCAF